MSAVRPSPEDSSVDLHGSGGGALTSGSWKMDETVADSAQSTTSESIVTTTPGETTSDPQNPGQTRQPPTDPQCDARIAAIFGGQGAVAATVDEPPGVNAGAARYRYDHLAGQGVFHIYTDANGSDKVTGLFIPPGGRLVSGGEYNNHGDTENYFRFSYTSRPYKGVQISLLHVGGTHGGEVDGQYLGNFHREKNAMGSVRIGNIAGPGGEGEGYNHTHVKVYFNGRLTDPRKVFCK